MILGVWGILDFGFSFFLGKVRVGRVCFFFGEYKVRVILKRFVCLELRDKDVLFYGFEVEGFLVSIVFESFI